MFNKTSTLSNVVNRRGLYRVWIRASEAAGAPFVSVWIDPEMRAFEPQVKAPFELPTESEHERQAAEGDARRVGHSGSRSLAFVAWALLILPAWS